jgi:hypothetical protein
MNEQRTGTLCIPTTFAGGTTDRKSVFEEEKERLMRSSRTPTQYRSRVRHYMMGKKGSIRSINGACIEGSIKMVISVGNHGKEGTVSVPRFVADTVMIPDLSTRFVRYRTLRTGDWGILVRQPCLWGGGIQPVCIEVTDDKFMDKDGREWNISCTMQLPPMMCAPYAADYDGDQMTLFPVTTPEAISECKSFKWNYANDHVVTASTEVCGRSVQSDEVLFDRMSMCTTTSFRDSKRDFKVTEAYEMVGLKPSAMREYSNTCRSLEAFVEMGYNFMKSGALKSSLQSDIGALSRRSKLGAGLIDVGHKGVPVIHTCFNSTTICTDEIMRSTIVDNSFWFGSPGVRGVSKLTSSVMQITLKVKSLESLSSNKSPLMSLLCGSRVAFAVTFEDTVVEVDCARIMSWSSYRTVCNIYALKDCPANRVKDAIELFVMMAINECGKPFDTAEVASICALVEFLRNNLSGAQQGIEIRPLNVYPYLRATTNMNARYFDIGTRYHEPCVRVPVTLFERMMVGNMFTLQRITS